MLWKDISTEKLIELLNEYEKEVYAEEHEHIDFPDWTFTEWDYWFEWDGSILWEEDWLNWSWSDYRCYNSDLVIISKSYWFIKRLVDNDKIDREKFWNSETKSSKYSDFELSYDTPREDYTNILLMELAIQDEPIQFLIEMLR